MTERPHIQPAQIADGGGDDSDLGQLDLASLVERGYTPAHFGDEPVLITPELAAQIRAHKEEQL